MKIEEETRRLRKRVSTSRTNNFPRKSTKHSTRKTAFCDFIVIIVIRVLLRIYQVGSVFLSTIPEVLLIEAEIDKKLYNLRRVYTIREKENLKRKFV